MVSQWLSSCRLHPRRSRCLPGPQLQLLAAARPAGHLPPTSPKTAPLRSCELYPPPPAAHSRAESGHQIEQSASHKACFLGFDNLSELFWENFVYICCRAYEQLVSRKSVLMSMVQTVCQKAGQCWNVYAAVHSVCMWHIWSDKQAYLGGAQGVGPSLARIFESFEIAVASQATA